VAETIALTTVVRVDGEDIWRQRGSNCGIRHKTNKDRPFIDLQLTYS